MPPRILLVDDYGDLLQTLGEIITGAGYEVTLTTSARTALRLYAERPFDVVITDIFMPDLDGIELIVELRRRYPDVRIIAMSGGGAVVAEDFLPVALVHGADRTIAKPVSAEALVAVMRELLPETTRGEETPP